MNNIQSIKINVAYDKILVYDEKNNPLYATSNVANYDIHPWHTITSIPLEETEEKLGIKFPYTIKSNDNNELKHELFQFASQNIENILDNTYKTFIKGTIDEFYSKKESFIYPIVMYNNDLFMKYETMDLNKTLVKAIHEEYGKLVFIQPTEGFFGQQDVNFTWLDNLCKKYNFSKKSVIMVTSNMIASEKYDKLVKNNTISDSFLIYPYSYFGNSIWFHNGYKLNMYTKKSMRDVFESCLYLNRNVKKVRHFLNFNRVPKLHRVALFGEFKTNEKLKNTSITTLGKVNNNNPREYHTLMSSFIDDDYKHSKDRVLSFFENYDATKHAIYDEPDLENNKASVFNKIAHTESFLNIVSESLIENDTIFFSEKIYKPIFAAQPFIMFGNPNSIKMLQKMGFKTFGKWWDESYDEETQFSKRMEKIVDVLEEISNWSLDKCFQVTQEMEEVLIHNFNHMLSDDDTLNLFKLLASYRIMI
jgi:hypothetical protein